MRNFGFECEVPRAHDLYSILPAMHKLGLWDDDTHEPHCTCPACVYAPTGRMLRAHDDSSCGGELVSNIFAWPSAAADECIATCAVLLAMTPGYTPGTDAGCHVHVSREGMSEEQLIRLLDWYVAHEPFLLEIAAQGFAKMRAYNQAVKEGLDSFKHQKKNYEMRLEAQRAVGVTPPPTPTRRADISEDEFCGRATCASCYENPLPADTSRYGDVPNLQWAVSKGRRVAIRSNTIEYRLWNSIKSEWRLRLNVGMSVAMTEAAAADALDPDNPDFFAGLGDHMTDETLAWVIRQAYDRGIGQRTEGH